MPKKAEVKKRHSKKEHASQNIGQAKKDHAFLSSILKNKKPVKVTYKLSDLLPKNDLADKKNKLVFDLKKLYKPEKTEKKEKPKLSKFSFFEKKEKKASKNPVITIKANTQHKRSPHIINLRKKKNKIAEKPQFKKSVQPNKKINLCYKEEQFLLGSDQLIGLIENQELSLASKEAKMQFNQPKKFFLPYGMHKKLFFFILISLLLITPFSLLMFYQDLLAKKQTVEKIAFNAFDQLSEAGKNSKANDLTEANEEFLQASKSFGAAQTELNDINVFISSIIGTIPQDGKTLNDAKNLLAVGENISLIGERLTSSLNSFSESKDGLEKKLLVFKEDLKFSSEKIDKIESNLAQINTGFVPKEYQEKFLQIKTSFPKINASIKNFIELSDVLYEMLGVKKMQRFLLVFQNNNELRATGGFMGSFALLDLENGKIKNLEIPKGGSYDLQGSLSEIVASPEPLRLINSRWEFQDANWFADFPTSAEKIQWFYEKAGGPSVDGVIAINASFFQDLLKLIGPIKMLDYDKELSADNFFEELQKEVESGANKENKQPKKIISDLAFRTIKQIFEFKPKEIIDFASLFNKSLEEKNILIYLNDPELQKTIDKYQWSGRIKQTVGDYLSVVNTNIAGGKTDQYISQEIKHSAKINADGSITNTVKIVRTHLGNINSEFGNIQNVDYVRIFVPFGSELLEASGFSEIDKTTFKQPEDYYNNDEYLQYLDTNKKIDSDSNTEIYTENDKTVFGNWILTPPGKTSEAVIVYKLPFKVQFNQAKQNLISQILNFFGAKEKSYSYYSLLIQKQPGVENSKITSLVSVPKNILSIWNYPQKMFANNNEYSYSDEQNADKIIGLIFQKENN